MEEIKNYVNEKMEKYREYEMKNFRTTCCFCGSDFPGKGNSTWPIYYKEEGEKNRCCDGCNSNIVLAARNDRSLVMKFREQFGISYEENEEKKNGK